MEWPADIGFVRNGVNSLRWELLFVASGSGSRSKSGLRSRSEARRKFPFVVSAESLRDNKFATAFAIE